MTGSLLHIDIVVWHVFLSGHSQCVALLRHWTAAPLAKENDPTYANTARPAETPPPVSGDPGDQSMAETFVSLYLNMTQVNRDRPS